jgi:shikimate 5-dehydrogenase
VTGPPNVTFIGVTTASSAIMRVFPAWARHLRLGGARLTGCDLPLRAQRQRYRDVVAGISAGPLEIGALITSHKIDLFRACRDMFDYVDGYAELCGEASTLSKRDGEFRALARDPVSCGRALGEFIEPGYWAATGGHALLLGSGGSGLAISLHLLTGLPPGDRPRRIIAMDRDPGRLASMRAVHDRVGAAGVDYVRSDDPRRNDELLAALPPGSLVVNATGAGKDTPGSPVTDAGRFPDGGRVWELNYRGDLDFLRQARDQADAGGLVVHDGWRYFVHGWTSAIEEIFDLPIAGDTVDRLSEIALRIRTGEPAGDSAHGSTEHGEQRP